MTRQLHRSGCFAKSNSADRKPRASGLPEGPPIVHTRAGFALSSCPAELDANGDYQSLNSSDERAKGTIARSRGAARCMHKPRKELCPPVLYQPAGPLVCQPRTSRYRDGHGYWKERDSSSIVAQGHRAVLAAWKAENILKVMRYEVKLKFQEFFLEGSNTECVSGLEPYNTIKTLLCLKLPPWQLCLFCFNSALNQSVCIQLRAGSRLWHDTSLAR